MCTWFPKIGVPPNHPFWGTTIVTLCFWELSESRWAQPTQHSALEGVPGIVKNWRCYPPVNQHYNGRWTICRWFPSKMVIFHDCLNLPEGNHEKCGYWASKIDIFGIKNCDIDNQKKGILQLSNSGDVDHQTASAYWDIDHHFLLRKCLFRSFQ